MVWCSLVGADRPPKTTSYGAGNSKFFESKIAGISDFGRTSASQQKLILWDSGN